MSRTLALCQILLLLYIANQLVHGDLTTDRRYAFWSYVKNDPCKTDPVRAGDYNTVLAAQAECINVLRIYKQLHPGDQGLCPNARDPECALTHSEHGWPRCSFNCDVICAVKVEEPGRSRRSKPKVTWRRETQVKRYDIHYLSERVPKLPKNYVPSGGHPGAGSSGGSGGGGAGSSGGGYGSYGGGAGTSGGSGGGGAGSSGGSGGGAGSSGGGYGSYTGGGSSNRW